MAAGGNGIMSWATRPTNWGRPGHAERGNETEAILDQIELLTDSAIPVVKYKTANEVVNNSTTLQNDDHLFWSTVANGVYTMDLNLFYDSGTTPDFKFDWTYPVGTTFDWGAIYYNLAGTLTTSGTFTEATVGAVGGLGVGTVVMLKASYVFVMGPSDGTLQMQFAQNTANASNTTLFTGSYGVLTRANT